MIRASRVILLGALAAATLPMAGCGSTESLTRTFGLTRDAPDEFAVTTRAPLSMPPDYTLRPPRPGATRPQELPLSAQAEATLVPQAVLAKDPRQTTGQQALVAAAGPSAPDNIREEVDAESQLDRPGHDLTDRLLFWRSPPPAGTVVDPAKESARLRANAALGRKPDRGDTPIIQRKPGTLLGDIF